MKKTKKERMLEEGEIVSMEPLKGSAKAPAVEPKAEPKAATPVESKPTCPVCKREFKSALAVSIHAGFAHKADKAGTPKPKADKPAKTGKPPAPTGMYSVTVPAENVAEVVTALTKAGVREIRVVRQ